MAWQDRVKELAYNSPSGVRIVGDFENVSKSFDKKTTGFEFPDADGTYVQDLGNTGRRYPLRFILWGNDYDLQADALEAALAEKGVGKLEHPLYGTINVVPFGTITRRDDLKTAANQAIFDITFWETIGAVYPASTLNPKSSILDTVSEFNTAASDEFLGNIDIDTAIERVSLSNEFQGLLNNVKSVLSPIAKATDAVNDKFNDIYDSINNGIDTLLGEPATLLTQAFFLVQSPANAITSITTKIDAYSSLINTTTSKPNITQSLDSRNANKFFVTDAMTSSYVTGTILSSVNAQFTTKVEAIEAAEVVLTQLEEVTTWRENNYESLEEIDTGESYQKLQEAAALTAGFLVEISFSLKQERRVVLDRNRTIIDLSAELYGSIDDELDFLISSNDLSGSEILELPKGREIVYYI